MDYIVQTEATCAVRTEADVQKFLADIAKSENPVKVAIYKIAGFGNIQPLHARFVRRAGGYVEDRFGNLVFNF